MSAIHRIRYAALESPRVGKRYTIVRAATLSDRRVYDEAAALHIASIHHGLLPDLGPRFLSRLYFEIDRAPGAGVWAAVDSGRVVGFLAGCGDTGRCYRSVLARAGVPLTARAAGALFKPSVARRLPTLLKYPFRGRTTERQAAETARAELLAIAVDEGTRGHGLGAMLVEAFEEGLRSWGVHDRYLVATNAEDAASKGFYERVGFTPIFERSHNALTLQVYAKRVPASGG